MNSSFSLPRTTCPVCGFYPSEASYTHRFDPIGNVSILKQFDIIECIMCGMIYANNIPSQQEFDEYYARFSKYEDSSSIQNLDSHFYNLYADYICEVVPDKFSHIVDVGCGQGGLLINLKQRGYHNLTGVEISSENCAKLKNLHGINSLHKSVFALEQDDLPDKPVCIFSSAMLEHIVDVRIAVQKMVDVLSDKGHIIFVLPNANYFSQNVMRPFEAISMEHVNYFTSHSLNVLMAMYGMTLCTTQFRNQNKAPEFFTGHFCKLPEKSESINQYINLCKSRLHPSLLKIQEFVMSQLPIVLWGAGTLSQYLLANTSLHECNIMTIVDSNKHYQGNPLAGITIHDPQILKREEYKNVNIIVSTYYFNHEIVDVIQNKMKLNNPITCIPCE